METIHIKLTQQHIDNAIVGNVQHCPVALAIAAAIPTHTSVFVGNISASVYNQNDTPKVYALPEEVTELIRQFDNGRTILPLEFDMVRNPQWE